MHTIPIFLSVLSFVFTQPSPKFEEQLLDDKVSIGYGLAIGDVDGDKKPDILLADKKQFVWYRNGDWKRFVMVDNLTESDNVCIAARDLDGDGKVEVAVGAQWNPSETSDTLKSGAVYYLLRPNDPKGLWKPVKLHHEPVTHRMRWVKTPGQKYHLVVLPLHGRGNQGGEGKGVKVFAYEMPSDPGKQKWKLTLIDDQMHLTHNLDVVPGRDADVIYIGGKEGVRAFAFEGGKWSLKDSRWAVKGRSFGEVRVDSEGKRLAGIEPMHGNELTVYALDGKTESPDRLVLTSDLKQGHGLAVADLFGSREKEIVVGWRDPNSENKVGIRIFVRQGGGWNSYWVDDNGMACEDLQIADLNADGKPDIIAAGRASKNLKIYWNRN